MVHWMDACHTSTSPNFMVEKECQVNMCDDRALLVMPRGIIATQVEITSDKQDARHHYLKALEGCSAGVLAGVQAAFEDLYGLLRTLLDCSLQAGQVGAVVVDGLSSLPDEQSNVLYLGVHICLEMKKSAIGPAADLAKFIYFRLM